MTERQKLPTRRRSAIQKVAIVGDDGVRHAVYIHAGIYPDGRLGEVFVDISRKGTTLNGMMDALAMTISIALQHGTPPEALAAGFIGTDYPPAGAVYVDGEEGLEPYEHPQCSSITDLIGRILATYAERQRDEQTDPDPDDDPDDSGVRVLPNKTSV